jgi:uncharacterized protein
MQMKSFPDPKALLVLPGVVLAALSVVVGLWLNLPLFAVFTQTNFIHISTAEGIVVFGLMVVTTYCALQWLSAVFAGLESFQASAQLLEQVVSGLNITPMWAWLLSLSSAIGEELFFRGVLLLVFAQWWPMPLAIVAQAVVFAVLHPAPRQAWAYPLWALLAGIIFGGMAVASGSLWPGALAHYIFNHESFNSFLEKTHQTI